MKSNEAVTWLCYTELQKYMEELFMEILRVENICKTYEMDNAPVHALSDVSFPSIKESLLQSLEHLGLASLPCCTF